MDQFLQDFIENAFKNKITFSEDNLSKAKSLLKTKDFIQESFQDGSKIIACSDRVRLTLKADDHVEKIEVQNRPEYFKWVFDNYQEYLKSYNITCTEFSQQCWKNVADAEYQISLASLNPLETKAETFLFHRARTWAHVMLFYLHDFLHVFISPELIESTALRGLALAIMDDAEDAKEDLIHGEHTIFSAHPEKAGEMCFSVLSYIEKYQEKVPLIFQFFEKSVMGQSVLHILMSAAAIRVDQFLKKEEGEGLFSVRNYLKSLV